MRHSKFAIFLIVAVGLIVGASAIGDAWHFDDFYTIVNNKALRKPANILDAFHDPGLFSADPARKMYRPVLVISYILNFRLLGESAVGFLAINLLLHLINALLVWAIACKLSGVRARRAVPLRSNGMELGALAAGLIYAVHPAATEGIAYASARSAVLATTFTLCAFLLYIRWDRGRSAIWLVGAAALFVLGLGAKTIAVVLPAVLVMYHLWFPPREGVRWKRAGLGVGLIAILAIGYVFLRKAVMGVVLAESLVRPIPENLLTQSRASMHYFRLFLWPLHQSVNPYFPTYPDPFHPEVIVSLSVLGGLIVLCLALWRSSNRSWKVVSFGLLWILISLLPESSIIPLNLVVSERRLILPLVGYSLLLGAIIGMVKAGWRPIITVILVICLSSLAVLRLREWRSEESLWREAVRVDPHWGLLWNNLGLIYLGKPDARRAEKMFKLAARHDPEFAEARLNLGHLYAMSGQNERAGKYYAEALAIKPGYAKAAVMLAQLWDRDGRGMQARGFLRDFTSQYPAPRAYYMLGVFEENDGNAGVALQFYRKALAADPFDPLPNLALCRLLAATRKRNEALEGIRRFLELYRTDDRYRSEALRLIEQISHGH